MWMVRFPPPPVGAPYLNVSLSSSTWSWISAPEGKEQTAADSQRVCASVCVPLCDFKSVKRTEEKSGREWYCQQKKHHYNNESILKWLHHYTDLKLPPDSPLTVKTTSLLVGVRKDLTLGSLRPLKIAHTSYSTHLLLVKNLCVCVCVFLWLLSYAGPRCLGKTSLRTLCTDARIEFWILTYENREASQGLKKKNREKAVECRD